MARFLRDTSQQAILLGSFGSVRELVDTIENYVHAHNLNPKPYQWRADGQSVLEKIKRAWDAAVSVPKIPPKAT